MGGASGSVEPSLSQSDVSKQTPKITGNQGEVLSVLKVTSLISFK